MNPGVAERPFDGTLEIGVKSDIGQVRAQNQDAYLVRSPLFAVADGMGGTRAGEVASALALEALQAALAPGTLAPSDLRLAIESANRQVFAAAARDPNWGGMGTTLTAIVLQGGQALIGHVGDSRAYLWRDGRLVQLTQDHSYVGELMRLGQITADEARSHPHRNVLTRALGTQAEIEVDIGVQSLKAADTLLLCTDGLTGLLDEQAIAEQIGNAKSAQAAADALVAEANRLGGPDNITVIVVRVGDSV